MKKHTEYTIGSGPAPGWCAGLLAPYRKYDGSVGYEFHGWCRDFNLCIGDKLIQEGKMIKIRRVVSEYES